MGPRQYRDAVRLSSAESYMALILTYDFQTRFLDKKDLIILIVKDGENIPKIMLPPFNANKRNLRQLSK